MYPVPAYGNLKSLGALTQGGDVKPSYAGKVITGLERNFVRKQQPVGGERFVASTDGKGWPEDQELFTGSKAAV